MKKKINIPHIISFVIFFGFLITLSAATLFSPKKTFSEDENRNLSSYPEFSAKKIFDRSYMKGVETYLADHFVNRSDWISAKTTFELACGKREINGIYIMKNRLAEKLDDPDYSEIDKSIDAINIFSQDNPNLQTFVMLVPTSTEIYKNDLPKFAETYSQKDMFKYVYDKLDKKIVKLDVYDTMSTNKHEYIYYRNDHHWTTLGAFYAYQSAGKKMGFVPTSYSNFNIEHASEDFKGTLYSKAMYDGADADTIDIFTYSGRDEVMDYTVNTGNEILKYDDIYFREYLGLKDKYSTFLGTNEPIVSIRTNADTSDSIIIFKDSYAHCFAPFLMQHYSKITLVDMRYINDSYKNVVDMSEYNQALFLYNGSSFAEDRNIKKLKS